ncbi:MAG: hypothetical protein A3I77_02695 [Gammaproteobacteria bacterium RIFCSPLOWO2_02_FULL_42_14]|nr:MAG: hypothetical protein A3B71_08120 [Gammaproteobacteria bacterium RIFCSPHIGHO2_02_FULL_42_43]OGT28877.1 MAG: hypothetical protein A2624_05160 [Gammaproteobacteria bacterium RIFCSPHIGHO2_01_FULL_42_8]OGT52379.1 MAG: hypothetical protein A3E54_01995 [Gammaproteobacteria bacterium RIFCSPHIGHO2_12_FULL_41_25]OGT63329.1 MAG: hypothetical protein A3I77_02695 [Gammaproteobacteria bacterium RIFCSPLOWO2_02_FULL_42_14]OGT86297.1 MAG: hypothetical protein A3G86_07160 [Gammaproteobacteria bacterium R
MRAFFHAIYHFILQNDWALHALLILLIMIIFHLVFRKTHLFLLRRLEAERHVWPLSLIQSIHLPWLIFFWFFAISFIIPDIMLNFHIDFTQLKLDPLVNTVRSLFFIAALYWSLMRFITNMEERIAPRWSNIYARDKTMVRAVAQLSRVILTILVTLITLSTLHFPMGSLLAFGGFGGVAAGFAAKDTLANFLGGMMIFWDRPFSVGDWIRSPDRDIEGTVEHIGWRLTRIRTFTKRPLYVPNGIFSSISIENPARMTNRRINVVIGVRYDDVNVIDPIVKEMDEMLRSHPGIDTRQTIMVHFTEFAASSLNINVYAFTKTTDWAKYRSVQQDVFLKCIAIISTHGAECAFPTTTVYLQGDAHVNGFNVTAQSDT